MNIFITGVSSGVGLGLSKRFLADGDQVYACSRREPENVSELNFISMDLSKLETIEPAVIKLLHDVNRLSCVVLNAGVLGDIKDMKDSSIEELQHTMNVNLWSNKLILDAIFKTVPQVEQVIAISSGAAVNGNRGWSGYSISKAALNMMIKLYAAERHDTHFTAFAPGLIDTAIQDDLCSRTDDRFSSIETLKSARGTDRMPNPDVFANQFKLLYRELLDYPSGSFLDIRSI